MTDSYIYLDTYVLQQDMRVRLPKAILSNMGVEKGKTRFDIYFDSKDNSFFIDFYYNKNLSLKFILTGNKGFCKSYNYHKNTLYNKYNDNNIYGCYNNVIVNTSKNSIKLIGTTFEGNISIWDFCSGQLLNKIKIYEEGTYGNYFWKNT